MGSLPSWQMVVMTIVSMATQRSTGMHVTQTYRDINGDQLQNMDIDQSTGDILVINHNTLAKLTNFLSLQQTTKLKGCNSSLTSNSLVINKHSRKVIICCNGVCEIHSLMNISQVTFKSSLQIMPAAKVSNSLMLLTSSPVKLHVANSFHKNVWNSAAISTPLLSSRNADTLDLFTANKNGSSAKYVLTPHLADDYNVQYIYSFTQGNYIYFISQQSVSSNDAVLSKILRICLNDKYYRSYVEIKLDCLASSAVQFTRSNAANYDPQSQKVYIAFTGGNNSGTSAVCVFNVNNINKMMDNDVRNCYQGNGRLGPAHFHKISLCKPTATQVDFCGQSVLAEGYSSIEGQTPMFQRTVITLPNTVVTALTTRLEDKVTIVYLATSNGQLKKVTISASGVVAMVSEMTLDLGRSVLSPMFLDKEGQYLYTMTKSKMMKVDVDHCHEKTTCQQCTSSVDPQCGWCVLQNRCSKKSACPSAVVSPRWLSSRNGVCAEMKDVYPRILSYESLEEGSDSQISFKLDKISVDDPANIDLHCSFVVMDMKHVTMATISGAGAVVTCPLPTRANLPTLPHGVVRQLTNGDHRKMEIEFQIQGKSVVKRDVSLYDCGVILNCTSCTDSSFGCKWCHVRGMCLDATKPDCPAQTVPAIQSPSSCPRMKTSSQDKDILVHSGMTKQIVVRVENIQADQLSNIHCVFTYLGNVTYSTGTITSSNLVCEPVSFSFNDTSLPIETADFTVTAGSNSIPLDNPQDIKVRIYKCGPMVTNCGQCLSMDPEYDCGWCTAGIAQCSLESSCPKSDWLNRTSTCPHPQILRFNPLAGPIQGKTNISVHGLNLGKSHTDLVVTVAGRPCVLRSQHYESSQRFDCVIIGPDTVTDGVIKVKVNGKYTTESDSHFNFVDPMVTDLTPKEGPISGGTTLTITGDHMNAGSLTTVDVGGSPCTVDKSDASMLECVTSHLVANQNAVEVEVNFGDLRKLVPVQYTYVTDPEITRIEPKYTFLSGGTSITAFGKQLEYIQNPQLFVKNNGNKITTDCSLQTNLISYLVCKTPKVMFTNVTETSPGELQFGFNLDGVTTYRNISAEPAIGPLLYYSDPVIENFPPVGAKLKKYTKDEVMVIKGNFHRVNPIMQDVHVTVGNSECTNPTAADDAFSCIPPEKPKDMNNGNALVILEIGNLEREVGYLSYYDNKQEDKPIAIGIILGVVLPILAIILLLTICVIKRHRKHKPSQNYIPDVWKDTEAARDDEGVALNNVSIKADMNGSIPDDKDTEPYIEELLSKIDDDAIRYNVKHFLISRRSLYIGDLLGKGNFGATCKATYTRTEEDNPTDVAVKTIHGSKCDSESVSCFLQTVTMYRDLQHPGVSPILGICITMSDDPMLVLPYARNGDVKTYVRDSDRTLTVLELLDFGVQIAEAMSYLESVHVVHGNLALRNCLVTDDKKVQLSDYGLTKDLFTPDQYFIEDGKLKSLVKWTALEALHAAQFTVKSDVWSYGVVLWELLTRGVTPYPDVENADLENYLEKGNRMKKPRQCPENIYEFMLRCWAQESDVRPTFRQVADEIHGFMSTEGDEQTADDGTPLTNNISVNSASEFI